MQQPDSLPAGRADAHATQRLVSRLAVIAVQGEQLQALCDELAPLVATIAHHPQLQPSAAALAAVLAEVTRVAQDIALSTEMLGSRLLASPSLPAPDPGAAP
jgi:hypothetical protein